MKKIIPILMAVFIMMAIMPGLALAAEADLESLLKMDAWGLDWGMAPYSVASAKGAPLEQRIDATGASRLHYAADAEWGEGVVIALIFRDGLDTFKMEFNASEDAADIAGNIGDILGAEPEDTDNGYIWAKGNTNIELRTGEGEAFELRMTPIDISRVGVKEQPQSVIISGDSLPVSAGESFALDMGEWVVGEHLSAGLYSLSGDGFANLDIYDNIGEEDAYAVESHSVDESMTVDRIVIANGQILMIADGDMRFTPLGPTLGEFEKARSFGEPFVIEEGEWAVGDDIPAGNYALAAESSAGVDIYRDEDILYYYIDATARVGRVVLTEGQSVMISEGSVRFTPFAQ